MNKVQSLSLFALIVFIVTLTGFFVYSEALLQEQSDKRFAESMRQIVKESEEAAKVNLFVEARLDFLSKSQLKNFVDIQNKDTTKNAWLVQLDKEAFKSNEIYITNHYKLPNLRKTKMTDFKIRVDEIPTSKNGVESVYKCNVFNWSAQLQHSFIFCYSDEGSGCGNILLSFNDHGEKYSIEPLGGTFHAIVEVDESKCGKCGNRK